MPNVASGVLQQRNCTLPFCGLQADDAQREPDVKYVTGRNPARPQPVGEFDPDPIRDAVAPQQRQPPPNRVGRAIYKSMAGKSFDHLQRLIRKRILNLKRAQHSP